MTTLVTIRHLRELRLCGPGSKKWFEDHGFDWKDFVRNGLDADLLEATGDPFALEAVRLARGR